MGSIAPVASQALTAFQVANKVISTIKPVASVLGKGFDFFDDGKQKSSNQALSQLQQKQELQLQQRQAAQNAALDKQQIIAKAQEAESQRRAALKRAVARQRVQYGASGIGSQGGSSEAVLLGLFEESDKERSARERLDGIRNAALDQNLNQQRRVNTLQREQLKEKNKLKNTLSPLETVKGFFDIF